MKKKIFAVSLLIIVLMSCLLMPVSAFSGMDDADLNTVPGMQFYNILGWDTMWFDARSQRVFFDNPAFNYVVDSRSDEPPTVTFNFWNPPVFPDEEFDFQINPAAPIETAGRSLLSWDFWGYDFPASTGFSFGFCGSTPVRCNFLSYYNLARNYFKLLVPSQCKFSYSVFFEVLVPVRSVASSGAVSYSFERRQLSYEGVTVPPAARDEFVQILPPFAQFGFSDADLLSDCIILSSRWEGYLKYDNSMFPSNFQITFQTLQSSAPVFSSPADIAGFASSYRDIRFVNVGDISEADFISWLGDSLSAFLSIRLFGDFSLGGILTVVLCLGLVVALIKIFS